MNNQNELVLYTDSTHQLYRISDYVILEKLGQGSYGRVYLAKNKRNSYLYAVKKFKTHNGIPTSTIREIGILKILQHPNIITFHQVLVTDLHCYMVIEYMKMSLDVFIKEYNISQPLLKSFMYQLLQAILFCHNRQVLHRDIKPQNILVHHNLKVVKLSDFGLAKRVSISTIRMTPNVVTFDYRSPELLMNYGHYSKPIDIWSLGCVFVEMVLKRAPFRGNVEMDLWFSWFTQLGVPREEDLLGVSLKLDLTKLQMEKNDVNAMKLMKEKMEPNAYDLVTKMFVYNQAKRINALEALHHDYFRHFDLSSVPAFNEENIGYPMEHHIPKELQVLQFTAEEVENYFYDEQRENKF